MLAVLSHAEKIIDIDASYRLHQYFGGRDGAVQKQAFLRSEQIDALTTDKGRAKTPADT